MLIEQVIAFSELSKPARAEVIATSLAEANAVLPKYPSIAVEELAVEIAVGSASTIAYSNLISDTESSVGGPNGRGNGAAYSWTCACANQPLLLILIGEDH